MTREEMLQKYEAKTAAKAYIVGFTYNGKLCVVYLDNLDAIAESIKLDRAAKSHGGMVKLRLRLDKWAKAKLARKAMVYNLDAMSYTDMKNRGNMFERFIHELNGKIWVKNSTPFWMAGDIELNGKQVQIKFDSAEITNEKTLAAL